MIYLKILFAWRRLCMKTYELTDYIAEYFSHFALHQRGLSHNTLSSYSDAVILFLKFCQSQKGIRIESLKFEHVSKSLVIEFCDWIEQEKHCSAATRNQRLTALHSVFRYILNETPMHIPLCRDILSIPMKKVSKNHRYIYQWKSFNKYYLYRIQRNPQS